MNVIAIVEQTYKKVRLSPESQSCSKTWKVGTKLKLHESYPFGIH